MFITNRKFMIRFADNAEEGGTVVPTEPEKAPTDPTEKPEPEKDSFDADAFLASLDETEEETGVEQLQQQLALKDKQIAALTAAYKKMRRDGLTIVQPPAPQTETNQTSQDSLTKETLQAFLAKF